ncbi:hypothetical protein GINT2_001970 [Glugoides intestinalis]
MSALLRLKNKSYFVSLLKGFVHTNLLTFEINIDTMKISSLEPPYIYLSLETDLYEITSQVEFSIRTEELIRNIEILDSSLIILDSSFKLVYFPGCNCNSSASLQFILNMLDLSFVEIPFTSPIKSYYDSSFQFPTRVIIGKEILKNLIRGKITYQHDQKKLIISKSSVEVEETLEVEAEFIETGYLYFCCLNDWIDAALVFYDVINTLILCFSDNVLSIKFLLKDHSSAYLEMQIRAIDPFYIS